MSYFYGTLKGNRGEATRCGSKESGMETHCASWQGAIRCFAYAREDGIDCVTIERILWHGRGKYKLLYDGPIGDKK